MTLLAMFLQSTKPIANKIKFVTLNDKLKKD